MSLQCPGFSSFLPGYGRQDEEIPGCPARVAEPAKGSDDQSTLLSERCARSATRLPAFGTVHATKDTAAWLRPGLIEEYSSSMDGIRQDFVVLAPPQGRGELAVSLEMKGLRAEAAPYGAKLIVEGSGRELAYSRLREMEWQLLERLGFRHER